MGKFVHLHGHTEYSLLDGLSKIKKLVKAVKEMEMEAVAVTDHGSMYGAIEFYKEATKEGIKPIIGVEVYVAKRSHKDKEGKIDTEPYHLTVLAKDHQGYQNLMKLVTAGHLEGYYYRPRVDKALLKQYRQGLIALSGCPAGEFIRSLKEDDYKEAQKVAQAYLEIFGEDNFYFELQNHEYTKLLKNPELDPRVRSELEHMEKVQVLSFQAIRDLSQKLGVKIVATNDFHYVKRSDASAQDAVVCVQTGKQIRDLDRLRMIDTPNLYIRNSEEMAELFQEIPEAIQNTVKLAQDINLELTLGKAFFPIFDIPQNLTPIDYLRQLCFERFKEKFNHKDPRFAERQDRLEYELSVIDKKGYATYFLIVADFMNWANDHGIITNTRGSAAGSFVLYCLGITLVDPIEFMLPFERFLNPDRPSLPDIDSDMADDRRGEIIEYVRQKYGEDKVAQIVTFGTMMGRAAVRDIGRVLGMAYADVDRIAKLVPPPHQGFHKPLEDAIKEVPDLSGMYKSDPQVKTLLDLAKQVEGTVRQASVHAAGVVIAPKPLTDFTPLQRDSHGEGVVTQYDMFSVGEDGVGLVKIDFLGIRNLSILGASVKIVKENRGVEVDLKSLPLDDKKTYQLLSMGETMGLFQIEGEGMTKYLMDLKPTNIFDISAMIALYRPGPLAIIPEYIARKHNPKKISFFDPRMEAYLERSLGLLVYQDDVLLTAINLAGYSWVEADKFRKAMGKKIPEEMAKQKDHFTQGCIQNGMSYERAEELFKLIEPFAAYGFNKCISGDTMLYDAESGEGTIVKELYDSNQNLSLLSLHEDQTLKPQFVDAVLENGVKPVFEVVTRRGLRIKVTDNHPLFTFSGWKELRELKIGDRIGTSRKAPLPQVPYQIEKYKLATLGYLLAEGNLCHPHGIYFYSNMEDELNDFINYAKYFSNSKISLNRSKPAVSVYVGKRDRRIENELFEWIKDLGLHGKKATTKIIPNFVFKLDKDQLSLFLAKIWQGDGCISLSQGGQFYYATSSETMAYQIQHLLLRLGIISTIHRLNFKYRGELRLGFRISVSRSTNITNFALTVGRYLIGEPLMTIKSIISSHPIISGQLSQINARGSKDVIPSMVLPIIQKEVFKSYSSFQSFALANGMAERLFWHDSKKIGYLRETVKNIANILDSKKLLSIADSDIYWDEIVDIKYCGKEMTYDLTIPETHNFVANDFIVHNSHAASYAIITYWTAYMKANYPVEFMAAVMSAEAGDTDKIASAMEECKKMGIMVLPPDVNRSKVGFTLEDVKNLTEEDLKRQITGLEKPQYQQAISFGLSAIKNVGVSAIESIIKARGKAVFKSVADLCSRVDNRLVNRKTLESLIKAGAMDSLGSRSAQLLILDQCLEAAHQKNKKSSSGQVGLFGEEEVEGEIKVELPNIPELDLDQMLGFEKDLLGFYLHEPPFLNLLRHANHYATDKISALLENEESIGKKVALAGIITHAKKVITKKTASEMAFITLSDTLGSIEGVIFPTTYQSLKNVLEVDKVVVVTGKVDMKEDKLSLVIDKALEFNPETFNPEQLNFKKINGSDKKPASENSSKEAPKRRRSEEVEISVPLGCKVEILKQVNRTLREYPGKYKVSLLLPNGGNNLKKMDLPFGIKMDQTMIEQIESLLGKGAIKLN